MPLNAASIVGGNKLLQSWISPRQSCGSGVRSSSPRKATKSLQILLPMTTTSFSKLGVVRPSGSWTVTLAIHMRSGDSKIPLGALIRKEEDPAPINLITPSDYLGIIDIMTQYCPHWEYDFNSRDMQRPYFYSQDNHKVLKILLGIFQNTPAYTTYIEKFERKWDGRGAYWALFDHYLGQHQVSHVVSKALLALDKARYTGETRNYNWEKYVNKHVKNHNILDSMVGRGDFMGFGERQQIDKLLEDIHCQPVEFMKPTIWGQPDVYNTFHKASMLLGDYIQ
jgi:hypothetical protein